MKMILVAVVMLAGISLHASSASCGDVHRLAAEGDVDGLRRMLDDDPSGVIVIDVKISREVIADFIAEVLKKQ